ncbi:hypothetical protein O1611_g8628 [Lasiodiplodia mahajangana]|uniref:Uncharacterized protein n=1 Tax=Lasiodiplodia mahajangana TaxID=1108764 RepID=A0ACC2JBY3_9PEZI|nr:hypothetical protein O1611_g8628 [Lasiodiplodia mahajangana]
MDYATLATTPGAMAPPGMTSNLIDPESRAWNVELTIGITLLPAILLVVLRVYARLRLARSMGVDDCNYACVQWSRPVPPGQAGWWCTWPSCMGRVGLETASVSMGKCPTCHPPNI